MDQAARVPAAAAAGDHLRVELVDQRGHRQSGAVAVRLVEDDAEVLAHPLHGEAEVELALRHRVAAVLHLPALRGAVLDDVDHGVGIEARLHREVDALRQPLHDAGDADLVHHLGELARPGGPHQRHGLGVRAHHRQGERVERLVVGAAHDRQLPVLGTRLTARHRGVDEADAELGGRFGELLRHLGRRGRVVDEDGARTGTGEHTVGSVHHVADVVVVADAEEHELGAVGRLTRRRSGTVAVERDPCERLLRRAVVHRHLVSLAGEMAGHGGSHDPETDEGD